MGGVAKAVGSIFGGIGSLLGSDSGGGSAPEAAAAAQATGHA